MIQPIIAATTRRATIADAVALAAIGRQTFFDTFKDTCTESDMTGFLESYFSLAQVTKELRNDEEYFYIAEHNGVLVGYARFMEDYSCFSLMKQWKALELKRLYVSQAFHGQGVAQELMEVVLNFATGGQYQVVWLGVWEHNLRAQRFYEKAGFTYSGHTHDFPIGDTPQTDRWYWKFL